MYTAQKSQKSVLINALSEVKTAAWQGFPMIGQ